MATKMEANQKETVAKAVSAAKPTLDPVNVKADPVKKAEPVKTEPVKKTVKRTAAKKETVKKATARKPAAKKTAAKKDIQVKAFVEYFGKQVEEKDMVSAVKKAWTKPGKRIGDIKTMELYIKPEEGAVYYVINGTDTGAVKF